MTDIPKKLSALAVASCVLALGGIAMLTPLGSFAHHGAEEGSLVDNGTDSCRSITSWPRKKRRCARQEMDRTHIRHRNAR